MDQNETTIILVVIAAVVLFLVIVISIAKVSRPLRSPLPYFSLLLTFPTAKKSQMLVEQSFLA